MKRKLHYLWKISAIAVLVLYAWAVHHTWYHHSIWDDQYSPLATALVECTGPIVLLWLLLWFMPRPVRRRYL